MEYKERNRVEGKEIEKLSDKDIVLYALYLLGGWQERIHTEDITLKCYQLAPSRFSWVKYPQYPDIQPVRFALEKVGAKHERLVEGKSERKNKGIMGGWRLTESGIRWIEANRVRMEQCLGKDITIKGRLPEDRRIKELLRSTAFKKFESYGEKAEISHAEFAESLVCTVNTRADVLNERLKQLYSAAEELKRQEIKNYVNFCREKFASLLVERGG
jgi:predicted HTH domain antitoxin